MSLVQKCPPPGQIAILVVTRRRQLLDVLIAWAKKAGGPLRGPIEPTPAEVVAAANQADERHDLLHGAAPDTVRTWAAAVERAAYGPEFLDEQAEKAVLALEPLRPPLDELDKGDRKNAKRPGPSRPPGTD